MKTVTSSKNVSPTTDNYSIRVLTAEHAYEALELLAREFEGH